MMYQTGDVMNNPVPNTVLLVAQVPDHLQAQLAESFVLCRLYEHDDPFAFLREQGENIAAVVTRGDVGIENSLVELMPHLGLVSIFGVGTDAVDLNYLRARNIMVTITSGVLTNDVADLAIGLLLAGARQICQGDKFVREGHWPQGGMPLATKVSGKKIGIFGLGHIGKAIARRAEGFDMEIFYTSRNKVKDVDYHYCESLKSLAEQSDFLIIAASAGEENHGVVNATIFEAMPDHAWLINIARGSLIDEDALIYALQHGQIAGAGLDVFINEPHIHQAFLSLENVILQPHVASATKETRQQMGQSVYNNVTAFFANKPLPNAID